VRVTETERVEIREFESGDIQALRRILADPDVMEYSSKGPLNEAETSDFVEWCVKSYKENGYGQWAVVEKESRRLIGCCGLSRATVDECDEVEIGYRLAKERWEKGLASEAANGVLAYGFQSCNIESIVGIVSPGHSASIRVLEKLRFRAFSETRYCGWNVRVYRMSRKGWESYNTSLQSTSGRDAAFLGRAWR
jgi:[ribosomal protein S5]-alanine N-acetyltransferase